MGSRGGMSAYPRVFTASRRRQSLRPGEPRAPGSALSASEMSHYAIPEATGAGSSGANDSPACELQVHGQLPTMPRNALRKVFGRPDFTPSEVALLGHRRLERAEGIGRKSLAAIIDWLRCQGYELAGESRGARSRDSAGSPREVRKLEKAMRVLQTHVTRSSRVSRWRIGTRSAPPRQR